MDEVFHHIHHTINRNLRSWNPDIPDIPEERNPIFYVYPICMGISIFLCILWLTTNLLHRKPIIALIGNATGGILIMTGGISAMRHAEKHINLNEVSDEELLTHPIFIHNFVMCIISIFGMILYFIPMWILFDIYKWNKMKSTRKTKKVRIKDEKHCSCSHSRKNNNLQYSPRTKECHADIKIVNPISDTSSPYIKNLKAEKALLNCSTPRTSDGFCHLLDKIGF